VITTSSYRDYRPSMGRPVVVSLSVPRWMPQARQWARLEAATPRGWYFHASDEEFEREYMAQIERHRDEIIEALRELEAEGPVTLLCHESKDPETCHRRQLAAAWQRWTGEQIQEAPK
jgi:uncharacterized protein YeaO (DUF488 family)